MVMLFIAMEELAEMTFKPEEKLVPLPGSVLKTMVSPTAAAAIVSRRLPAPESDVFKTVRVAGTTRSSGFRTASLARTSNFAGIGFETGRASFESNQPYTRPERRLIIRDIVGSPKRMTRK